MATLRRVGRARQRGAALLIMMALLAMGGTYLLVSALGTSANRTAADREYSANALRQAKLALIGYVAQTTLDSGERNPGRLPCPEPSGNYRTANEGIASGNCTLPAVGRLPWRTLGIDKLTDASGEPLWYVVSPDWALSNSTTPALTTFINSNLIKPGSLSPLGQLEVDSQANAAVALIIAPGPVMSVAGATGSPPQRRNALVAPDFRDYLEGENATWPADAKFVSTGLASSFNDQVLKVTTADLLPVIEAAIANRIERTLAPELASAAALALSPSTTSEIYPLAAQWPSIGSPTATPADSSFVGTANTLQGLLPVARSTGCVVGGAQCVPASAPQWQTATISAVRSPTDIITSRTISSINCSASTADTISCTVVYGIPCPGYPPTPCTLANARVRVRVIATASNVGTAFREIAWSDLQVLPYYNTLVSAVHSVAPALDGTAVVTTEIRAPSSPRCTHPSSCSLTFQVPVNFIKDNAALQTRLRTEPIGSQPDLRWFVGNGWHQLTYYAIAPGHAPGSASVPCVGATCLSVSGVGAGYSDQHALLIIAGRSLSGAARPATALSQYLEAPNGDGDTAFGQRPVNTAFNDRIVRVNPRP